MSPDESFIDVTEHPVGYITDFQPNQPSAITSKEAVYADTGIILKNIPDTATVTLHIEFVNFTASLNPSFTISTQPVGKEIRTSTSEKNLTHQIFPGPDAYMILMYAARNQQIDGEFVRLMYKGLSP